MFIFNLFHIKTCTYVQTIKIVIKQILKEDFLRFGFFFFAGKLFFTTYPKATKECLPLKQTYFAEYASIAT